MERQISLSCCIICKSQCVSGISILGKCICPQCEAALVASKATSPGYDIYVRSLRTIWQGVSWEKTSQAAH
ncbi:MAG: sigma-G inhibitor, Gin [Firmicutes bacterium]|nr:sigma-G inhibitor, Gin [Bacillota bacterium]